MGVIQSSVNQSLLMGAALYSQSPQFQQRKEAKIKGTEIEKAHQATQQAYKRSKESALSTGSESGTIDPYKAKVASEQATKLKEAAAREYELNPTDQNLKRLQAATKAEEFGKATAGGKVSYNQIQDFYGNLRNQINKASQSKAVAQSQQTGDFKSYVNYSEDENLENPYSWEDKK